MDEKAYQLLKEANAILARGDRGATFHYDAQRKAVEIAEFLQANGEALDNDGMAWMVDTLGGKVDQLVKGASDTLDAAQQSPTDAFFGSLEQDAKTAFKFGLPVAILALVVVAVIAIRR